MRIGHFAVFCLLAVGVALGGCAVEKPRPETPAVAVLPKPTSPGPETAAPPKTEKEENGQAAREPAIRRLPFLKSALLSELDYLEQRLNVYEDESARWQALDERFSAMNLEGERPHGWHRCVLQLNEIIASYSQLRDQLQETETAAPIENGQGYRQDIGYLEGNCDEVYKIGAIAVKDWLGKFAATAAGQMEATVAYYVENGKDEKAIAAYRNLQAAYPRHAIHPDITRQYGLALFRTGRVDEAIAVLREQGAAEAFGPGLKGARRLLADLLFVAGKKEEAKAQYQKLADFFAALKKEQSWVEEQLALLNTTTVSPEEMALFTETLRAFLLSDGHRLPPALREAVKRLEREFPASILTNRAQLIQQQAEQEVRTWVGRRLVTVDDLIEEKAFQRAIAMLEGLLAEDIPDEVRRMVQQTLDSALLAQNEEQEAQQQLREQTQAMQWEEAVKLLGLRKFDEAIAAFTALLGTEYDGRAKEKIQEAADLAATGMRRQAATLFVKARNASDPEQKKEFTIASWRLLKQITIKYPDSDIMPKVLENLKALEAQINRLDPSLLEGLTLSEAPSPRPPGSPPPGGAL